MIKGRATIGPIVNFIANKIKVYTIEKGIRKTEITAVNLNLFVTYIFTIGNRNPGKSIRL